MSTDEPTKPPSISTSDVKSPLDLESLLSPQANTSSFPASARASVTESEVDLDEVALDDEAQLPSVESSNRGNVDQQNHAKAHGRSLSTSSTTAIPEESRHQKSASISTIRSGGRGSGRISLLVNRDTEVKRGSVEGHQKLHEEFTRLEKEQRDEIEEEDHGAGASVDWDFWGDVMSDYPKFAEERPEELAEAITRGIPDTLRGMVWQLMAASKDVELESKYLKLLKDTSPHDKAILRDLGRTFPHHDFFTDGQGIGQENLYNVLKAYSLYDPQVGYCQGLPFVVAILLLNMPDEEAFSLLVRLMEVYDLRGHFLPEMPKLQLRLFQFDRLVEELLPVLHVHFLRQGVKSSMYCSQWFLTMFSYRFPLEIVFRIYDNCLANGIEAMFGFSIALLHKNEDILLGLKFDEILSFLNAKLFDRYKVDRPRLFASRISSDIVPPQLEDTSAEGKPRYRVDEFVNDAVSLRITPFILDSYSHEYSDMMREKNKHATEVDELMSSNRSLSAQVKTLGTSLAQLNTEHVEVLNELVKCRLRNEELESELVRYKLLYAEAMHENQDAQSSQRISLFSAFKRGSNSSKGS
ncbi:GTPase-activating protein [Marasmius crinis-equi]|uniref:GTPase-activating protein n=1 Tax=Marasmius crinis-equi TaxID=585013 RepID=A0ABR3FMM9_9AGAR